MSQRSFALGECTMKKKRTRRESFLGDHRGTVLVTIAMLAGGTQAQTDQRQTLSGLVDISVGESKPPGGLKTRRVDSGQMTTSWIGFRGNEDLGDGLSAIFALESFLRADTGASGRFNGDAFFARNTFVGLTQKGVGTVRLGRNTTPLFVSTLVFNAFGDSFGYSPSIRHYFLSGTVSGDTGWNDSVLLSTQPLGGATINLIAGAGEGSSGRKWGGNVIWFGGPAAATFAYQDVNKDSLGPNLATRSWQLGGSYDFGRGKLFAQLGKVDNRTTNNSFDLLGLGAQVTFGQGNLLAQWGGLKPDIGAKRNTFSVGYDYFISKRTDLYAVAISDKVKGIASGRGYSLGVRHRF